MNVGNLITYCTLQLVFSCLNTESDSEMLCEIKKYNNFFLVTSCLRRMFMNERLPNSQEHEDCSE